MLHKHHALLLCLLLAACSTSYTVDTSTFDDPVVRSTSDTSTEWRTFVVEQLTYRPKGICMSGQFKLTPSALEAEILRRGGVICR